MKGWHSARSVPESEPFGVFDDLCLVVEPVFGDLLEPPFPMLIKAIAGKPHTRLR
jgi:hypothetical protein